MLSDKEYVEALERNYSEITFAHHECLAYKKMWRDSPILYANEFLGLCSIALFNDMVAHLIKVLVMDGKGLTFWNIRKRNKKRTDEILKENGCDISFLKDISKKLKKIRNWTHFHIDREKVSSPKTVWKEAGLKYSETEKAIEVLLKIFGILYKERISDLAPFLSYDGSDAPKIVRMVKESNSI